MIKRSLPKVIKIVRNRRNDSSIETDINAVHEKIIAEKVFDKEYQKLNDNEDYTKQVKE